jgi:hypothetical protein
MVFARSRQCFFFFIGVDINLCTQLHNCNLPAHISSIDLERSAIASFALLNSDKASPAIVVCFFHYRASDQWLGKCSNRIVVSFALQKTDPSL